MVLSRVRLRRVKLVLVNLNPINDTIQAQSGWKLLPELCSLLENDSNEGTPPDFDASFWKRGRENVFLQMF